MKLKIATAQFAVSNNISTNHQQITQQIKEAKQLNCDVIHFPEASLSGYAGVDMPSFNNFDWAELKTTTQDIMATAQKEQIWVILGSAHPLSNRNNPHNSLYIINKKGEITDRYDKRFCAGDQLSRTGDLAYYTSGNHFSVFMIKGIKCSTLICHDYRYPELYRELKQRGVKVVFHSYHSGNMDKERQAQMESQVGEANFDINFGKTIPEITMPATMISYAANNYMWISCSNTSAKESCWGSFMVRPDGIITGRSERNKTTLLTTEIDTREDFYDSTKYWRERAIANIYYSGKLVKDPRSSNRNEL